jgi:chromosome segregation ATPase
MSTKDTLENMARNTWLAGLGSINSSKEALGKSIDAAQEKSNNLYDELLTRGEEIQNNLYNKKDNIQGKINNKRDEIQAKGKKLLGIGSQELHEEKLAQLNTTVDHLTSVVVNLIEKRNATAALVTKSAATKAELKAAADTATKPAKPAKPAKPVSKAASKKAT